MAYKRRVSHRRRIRRKHYRFGSRKNVSLAGIIFAVFLLFAVGFMIYKFVSVKEQDPVQKQRQDFITNVAPAAMRSGKAYGVLPSVTIAQAALESDWGNSQLSIQYHNLFGVKSDDPNNSGVMQTKEFSNGQWINVSSRFKIYPNASASIQDHDHLLSTGTTWNPQQYQHVLNSSNYVDAAKALQEDGYATDPTYAKKIIDIVQKYDLTKYDQNMK